MKRFLACLCAALLTISAAGCSSSDTSSATPQSSSSSVVSSESAPSSEALPSSAAVSSSEAVSSSAPAVSSEPPVEEVGECDPGYWVEDSYFNVWADVAFTLPKGWMKLTSDQILDILGAGADVLSGELNTDKESLSASISETDLYAFYTMKANGEAFFFLDIYDKEAGGVPNMTAEEYLSQLTALFESLSACKITTGELEFNTFCGKQAVGTAIMMESTEDPDAAPSIQAYIVVEHGSYFLVYCGTVNTTDKDVFDELTALIDNCTTIDAFDAAPPEVPAAAAEGEWDAGHWDGSLYTNEWADISFTLPEGWERDLSTENVIEGSLMNIFTVSNDTDGNVILMIIDKTLEGAEDMGAEEYLDIVMTGTLDVYESYTAELSPVETTRYGGKDTAMCALDIEVDEQYQVEQAWYVQDYDPYFIVTLTTVVNPEEHPETMETVFTIVADILTGE